MSTDTPIAHFVGGIPMADAESVFRKLGAELGPHVRRIPDGETGRRRMWISFVKDCLIESPDMEADPDEPVFQFIQFDGKIVFEINQMRFKDGVNPSDVVFKRYLPHSLWTMGVRMNRFTATRTIKGSSRLNLKMTLINWHFFICCFHMQFLTVRRV